MRAIGREEGLKQETFSRPEWLQSFLHGTDPAPTPSQSCGLPQCSAALEGKQGRLSEHTDLPPLCKAAAGQAGLPPGTQGAREPLWSPRGRCSNPEPCRVGWGRAEQGGTTASTHRNASHMYQTPRARSLAGKQQVVSPPTSNAQGCLWAARVAPLSIVGLTAPSSSRNSVPACPSLPSRGDWDGAPTPRTALERLPNTTAAAPCLLTPSILPGNKDQPSRNKTSLLPKQLGRFSPSLEGMFGKVS